MVDKVDNVIHWMKSISSQMHIGNTYLLYSDLSHG